MVDVAEWFNDFVSVAEGSAGGGPAPTLRRKGKRRLSLDSPASGMKRTGKAEKPLQAAGKQSGRKRKAAASSDADDERADEDTEAVAVADKREAADDGAMRERRRSAAAKAPRMSGSAKGTATDRVHGVRWAEHGEAATDSGVAPHAEQGVNRPAPLQHVSLVVKVSLWVRRPSTQNGWPDA